MVDVDAALLHLHILLYGELNHLPRFFREHRADVGSFLSLKFFGDRAVRHGHAYYAGYITAKRAVDILLEPHLKLAHEINTAADDPAGTVSPTVRDLFGIQQTLRDRAFPFLGNIIPCALLGSWTSDEFDDDQIIPGATSEKVQAGAGSHQVRLHPVVAKITTPL